MKITKRQLRKIIKEEKLRLLEESAFDQERFERATRTPYEMISFSIFNRDYMYDMLLGEVGRYLESSGAKKLRKDEINKMESAFMDALQKIARIYAE